MSLPICKGCIELQQFLRAPGRGSMCSGDQGVAFDIMLGRASRTYDTKLIVRNCGDWHCGLGMLWYLYFSKLYQSFIGVS
jgi:hypothetical protein